MLKDDPSCRDVLVATGTGVTPYRSMLPELSERIAAGYSVELFLGVRNKPELLFGADFEQMAEPYQPSP